MRQLRYSVAASLDGYIAGPNGEYEWIPMDPDIDFAAMYAGFSALVMGRRSYEVYVASGGGVGPPLPAFVYSQTLPEGERDGVDVAIIPILLGGGLPLLPAASRRLPLRVKAHRLYEKTGTLFVEYDVAGESC